MFIEICPVRQQRGSMQEQHLCRSISVASCPGVLTAFSSEQMVRGTPWLARLAPNSRSSPLTCRADRRQSQIGSVVRGGSRPKQVRQLLRHKSSRSMLPSQLPRLRSLQYPGHGGGFSYSCKA